MEITQRLAMEHARKEEAEAKALMVINSPERKVPEYTFCSHYIYYTSNTHPSRH